MARTYQEAWDELVMKCQYDTGGMNITEFQKSLIVWADSWVRAAQHHLTQAGGGSNMDDELKKIDEIASVVLEKINRHDEHAHNVIRKHLRRVFAMGEIYAQQESDGAKWLCSQCGTLNVNELRPFCIRCKSPRR